jgi:hypothetical protein
LSLASFSRLAGYAIFFNEYEKAMYIGLTSLVLRQAGHYIFEPPCHDKEQAMLGFDTENKVKIVITYGVIPALIIAQIMLTTDVQISLAQAWLMVTFAVVFGRVALLWYRYGFMVSMHWFVKFITDPFSTLICCLLGAGAAATRAQSDHLRATPSLQPTCPRTGSRATRCSTRRWCRARWRRASRTTSARPRATSSPHRTWRSGLRAASASEEGARKRR